MSRKTRPGRRIRDLGKARRQAFWLSVVTVGYNLLEGAVSLFAAADSGSTSLFGFGLDSFVESLSGSVMIWRFWPRGVRPDDHHFERIERRAERLVGASFFLLGGYVTYDAARSLWLRHAPEKSLLGLGVAVASVVVMPLLFLAKFRLGKRLESRSLVADSKETLACMLLSMALLVGLGLNFVLGLWWADSAAALVIAVLVFREGREAWEGEQCGESTPAPSSRQ